MKRIFILVLAVAGFATANAQLSFGGKAGLNLSTFAGEDADESKMKPGFHIGGLIQVPITESLIFQPELVFSTQGAKFKEEYMGESYEYKINTSYLNIPLLAKYQTASGFFGETGPQFGFLMSAKAKGEGESEDVKESFKKLDFAWAFGLGYKMENGLGINARYNLGLSNLPDDGEGKLKNSVFQVGVFYVLGGE